MQKTFNQSSVLLKRNRGLAILEALGPVILTLFLLQGQVSAGSFINLGFEEADFSGVEFENQGGTGTGPIGELLPGWELHTSFGFTNSAIWANASLVPLGQVSLLDLSAGTMYGLGRPTEGDLFLGLREPFDLTTLKLGSYFLSQLGEVPPNAQSLRFSAISGLFDVTINDTPIDLQFLGPGQLGADVSMFAGQDVQLTIATAHYQPPIGGLVFHALDGIDFSPIAVPEPSDSILLGIGILLIICLKRIRPPRPN